MIIEAFMQFIAAAVGTFGFSVLFRVPEKYYLDCSLIGGAGWLVCWILDNGVHTWTFLATLLATLFVTLASRLWAAKRKSPATMFLLPAIFPLVPGVGIYKTVYYLIMDEMELGVENGRMAFAAAVAIVIGIMCAYEVPQRDINKIFSFFAKEM